MIAHGDLAPDGGPSSATWRPIRSRGGAATGVGPEQHEQEGERPGREECSQRQRGDDPLDPPDPHPARLGRRPHASRHVPEPLSDTNMSGPAPVQAARPRTAAVPDRSGIRSASASARASGRTRDARPVAEGISGVRASPLRSSVPAFWSVPCGTRRTSMSPIR